MPPGIGYGKRQVGKRVNRQINLGNDIYRPPGGVKTFPRGGGQKRIKSKLQQTFRSRGGSRRINSGLVNKMSGSLGGIRRRMNSGGLVNKMSGSLGTRRVNSGLVNKMSGSLGGGRRMNRGIRRRMNRGTSGLISKMRKKF